MQKDQKKSYLYHFLFGASWLNLFPTRSRMTKEILARSDEDSLQRDWLILGGDMQKAIAQNEKQKQKSS